MEMIVMECEMDKICEDRLDIEKCEKDCYNPEKKVR